MSDAAEYEIEQWMRETDRTLRRLAYGKNVALEVTEAMRAGAQAADDWLEELRERRAQG